MISDLQKNDIEIEYYTTINLSNLHKKLDGWIIRNFQMLIKSLRMNFTMTQNQQKHEKCHATATSSCLFTLQYQTKLLLYVQDQSIIPML